ncbi:hypothetical protein J6TS2_13940 [Heyndrickxia sporothermodurans]|nr:hypothetical protein J6TS2_13940 [Heyndrickxia sporothermodurans]
MKYLEETIILVSVSWMIFYLYGSYQVSSVAYNDWLILIPILLVLLALFIFWDKKKKKGKNL